MLTVMNRKRLECGQMGYVVQATNMKNDSESCRLVIDPKLIDMEDTEAIEAILDDHVPLASHGIKLYIEISKNMVMKRAKQVQNKNLEFFWLKYIYR